MKNTSSIRRILLTFSVLSAFTFLLGIVYANSEGTNTVVSHENSWRAWVVLSEKENFGLLNK